MESRKLGKEANLSLPPADPIQHDQPQSNAEKAETARRLKPHSRSQLKLDEANKKPAGMTPVPVKKSKPTKWQFGIRSRNQPLEAIGCIYRALQKLGAEWVIDENFRQKGHASHDDRYVAFQTHGININQSGAMEALFQLTVTMAALCIMKTP
jgi:carbon catabolite-derepressing protein kinase